MRKINILHTIFAVNLKNTDNITKNYAIFKYININMNMKSTKMICFSFTF